MRNGHGRSDRGDVQRARGLAFACAASAGAHAGLVPGHLNGEPRLGVAFLAAVMLLVVSAAAIVTRPWDRRITSTASVLLAGLMLAYLVTRTTGIPVLDPEREAVDAVGIAANVVEGIGLVLALWLIKPNGRHVRSSHLQEVPR